MYLYLFFFKLNKNSFDLTTKKLYVFKPVQQKIKISNYGKSSVSFSFRCYAKRNYNITFAPANFKLAAVLTKLAKSLIFFKGNRSESEN